MKKIYFRIFSGLLFFSIQLLNHQNTQAQCPWGIIPGQVSYDTTIVTPTGINTLFIKFPKANPFDGMLTCIRLCISITGVVDSIKVENNSGSSETATVNYLRTDQISGPGLGVPLTNTINYTYPAFPLGPSTAPSGSGPDFFAIYSDTLLNAVTTCATITNSDSLFLFYGTDSVTYLYNILAFTNVSCSGGNYNSSIATSALVRFRFEYCTCPGWILPLTLTDFRIYKVSENKATLEWSEIPNSETTKYHYEVEMSRDGINFASQGKVNTNNKENVNYQFPFTLIQQEKGLYYFRIRQVYTNGYSQFSEIRTVTLKNSHSAGFKIYPNPSNGIVGIKFDNNQSGKKIIEIFNSQTQKVMSREIVVAGSFFQLVSPLQKGMYWIRVTDVTSCLYSVNQLFIK